MSRDMGRVATNRRHLRHVMSCRRHVGDICNIVGMSVHLSQDVVSATMAHLLLCENGSRFSFSHDFQDLLVGQMLNKLQGEAPGDFLLRRRNRGENGEVVMWADYSVNDYLFRPECLEDLSFYEFALNLRGFHFLSIE